MNRMNSQHNCHPKFWVGLDDLMYLVQLLVVLFFLVKGT